MPRIAPVLALLLTLAAPLSTTAQDTTSAPDDAQSAQFLFVQSAPHMTYADGTLTLENVSPLTLFFSDRPERIAGHVTNDEFLLIWHERGGDSFVADPPNATLSILGSGEEVQDVVVELSALRLDGNNLSYHVEVLDGELPASGSACSLFIDVIGMPLTPVSYAGVARRSVRRHVAYRY